MTKIGTATEPEATPAEVEPLGPLLKRAHKAANHLLRRILEPLGLTPVQATALAHLLDRDGLSLNELAERMHADPPTLSGVVDCLVSAGYAERREDPRDRRRCRLHATEFAWQIKTRLDQAEVQRESALTDGLSRLEVAQLKALLRRIGTTVISDER
jgi:DNA-binding MarR family transcriptional regulator